MQGIGLRLLLLLLIAAIPAAVVVGINTRQFLQTVESEAVYAARLRANEAALRHRAALDMTEQLLSVSAWNPFVLGPDRAVCDRMLESLRASQGDRITNVWVVDADATLRCSGEPRPSINNFAHLAWYRKAIEARAPVVGPVARGVATGVLVLTVAWPVLQDDRIVAVLGAAVPLSYLRRRERESNSPEEVDVWLVDGQGETYAVAAMSDSALPEPELLRGLIGDPTREAARLPGRDGVERIYAQGWAGRDVRILIGQATRIRDAEARAAALANFVGFALFVVIGLLVVGFGGRLLIVRPLGILSREVEAWRPGARFQPDLPPSAPHEVVSLARSFGAATSLLGRRDNELRSALTRCELLVAEVHHRVRNNLQIISSLLNLQASRLRDPAARAEFLSARNRIRAMATLYRHLETTTERDVVRLRAFLDELGVQLFDALGEPAGTRIMLQVEAPDLEMTADQAVPFALIVTELLTNALKFAFPDGRRGRIDVEVVSSDGEVRLRVEDDGVGYAEPPASGSTGLGVRLIEGFARQLGATIQRSGEQQGTRVELRFRLRRAEPQPALLVP